MIAGDFEEDVASLNQTVTKKNIINLSYSSCLLNFVCTKHKENRMIVTQSAQSAFVICVPC